MNASSLLPIIAGFGFRAQAKQSSFAQVFEMLAETGLDYIAAVPEDKASHAQFTQFCTSYGLEIKTVLPHELDSVETPTQSEKSLAYRNVGSVCEAVALHVAGRGAKLLHKRHLSDDKLVSCAMSMTIHKDRQKRS